MKLKKDKGFKKIYFEASDLASPSKSLDLLRMASKRNIWASNIDGWDDDQGERRSGKDALERARVATACVDF